MEFGKIIIFEINNLFYILLKKNNLFYLVLENQVRDVKYGVGDFEG